MEALLKVSGVVKDFPGVRALDGVDLEVDAGEVHCLLGQNGAGKSTLIKVLSGAHQPDGGEITWQGEPATFATPLAALRAGIATIYQELDLVDGLSVAENVFLGHEPTHPRLQPARRDERGRRARCWPGSATPRSGRPRRSARCPRPASRWSAWPGRCPTRPS